MSKSSMASTSDSLIKTLNALADTGSLDDDPEVRTEALRMSRELCANLQDPFHAAVELAFAPFVSMSARIAVDLDLFGIIDRHRGPIAASELAAEARAEELLVIRVMRPLTSAGFVKEIGERMYESTPRTKAMAASPVRSGHKFIWEMLVGASTKGPKFLKENGYRNPDNPRDGFFQDAFQTQLDIFGYMETQPEIQSHLNNFMGTTMGTYKSWIEWYPVQQRLITGAKRNAPLIVDVGGGKGHDLEAFHEKFPNKGRLVLQDLPSVINNLRNLNRAIEAVAYDFFREPPVKGARAYCLHRIMHNWPDSHCQTILRYLKEAMEPAYSRLLIHELILPDKGATKLQSMLDMTMMTFNSSMERSQRQWRELLEPAGFEIIRFWTPEDDGDGIVEAMLRR